MRILAVRWGDPRAGLRPLVAPATWLATAHLLIGPVVGLITVLLLLLVGLVSAGRAVRPAASGALAVQCSRFSTFLGVRITSETGRDTGRIGTGRLLGFHAASGAVGLLLALATTVMWSGGLVLASSAVQPRLSGATGTAQHGAFTLVATIVGVVMLLAAPRTVGALTAVDVALARAVLDPASKHDLSQRVASLTVSRADVIAAADAERRRIERDLHDGAQQRLVSLAMRLGLARAAASELPSPARQEIERAHEDAKQALVELRDLVRGLHPAILDDLGLDAALSGIVARCPVPVTLHTDIPGRLPARIETVAYFVVSEALTNIARHATAASAQVSVHLAGTVAGPDTAPAAGGERLALRISDDGRGGARVVTGGGLHGLQRRVGSVDGTFHLDSPPGGPTTIRVELPCASS